MPLSDDIREYAREAGFDLVGIASVDPLSEAEEAMLERLRSGMLEGMSWITEERVRLSCDPRRLLPGARSAIVLGKNHLPPEPTPTHPAEGPTGTIARYARGDDYHDCLRPAMARIVDRIAATVGRQPAVRYFVDSSPLAERALAARAGIGWFGKNSCLLTTRHGSWILLAEILLDLELEPDPPLRRDCGRCRICIDRCPTGAIVAPYVVDARRCISYLTIEHKGAIPLELRPLMGDRIFGCDVCQEVCPHNRLVKPTADPAFAPRKGAGSAPGLLRLMSLGRDEFKRLFQGGPVLRSKRQGLLRNVAVALGNAGNPAAVPVLSRALEDEEPLVRSHAAWALSRLTGMVHAALPCDDGTVMASRPIG